MAETNARSVTDTDTPVDGMTTEGEKLTLSVKLAYGLPTFAGIGGIGNPSCVLA